MRDAILIQVAVGEHQIQLHWDNGIRVLCETELILTDPAGYRCTITGGRGAAPLLRCIGMRALGLRLTDQRRLSVDLVDGSVLAMVADDSGYESFQVVRGDEWVLIW